MTEEPLASDFIVERVPEARELQVNARGRRAVPVTVTVMLRVLLVMLAVSGCVKEHCEVSVHYQGDVVRAPIGGFADNRYLVVWNRRLHDSPAQTTQEVITIDATSGGMSEVVGVPGMPGNSRQDFFDARGLVSGPSHHLLFVDSTYWLLSSDGTVVTSVTLEGSVVRSALGVEDGFLIAFTTLDAAMVMKIGFDGQTLTAPTRITDNATPYGNGNRDLLVRANGVVWVLHDTPSQVLLAFRGSLAGTFDPMPITLASNVASFSAASADDRALVAVANESPRTLIMLDQTTTPITTSTIGLAQIAKLTAFPGWGYLASGYVSTGNGVEWLDLDGIVVGTSASATETANGATTWVSGGEQGLRLDEGVTDIENERDTTIQTRAVRFLAATEGAPGDLASAHQITTTVRGTCSP